MYYNKIMLSGNVTRDAELKYSQSGAPILTFSIGVNKSYKDAQGNKIEKTIFPNCVMFGKGAEALAQYITKGKGLFVEGELNIENYEDKEGIKRTVSRVIVRDVRFTGGPATANTSTTSSNSEEPETNGSYEDDEPPF